MGIIDLTNGYLIFHKYILFKFPFGKRIKFELFCRQYKKVLALKLFLFQYYVKKLFSLPFVGS